MRIEKPVLNEVKFLVRKYLIKIKFYRARGSYQMLRYGTKKKRIILMGTPEYGNLGDHAIASSELQFLKKEFPDCEIVEITQENLKWDKNGIFKWISSKDILLYTGGGFLGSMYRHTGGGLVRDIMRKFSNSAIIIFPSTIFYENTKRGEVIKKEDYALWSECNRLCIFARDVHTWHELKENAPQNVKLYMVPDMALSLSHVKLGERRDAMIILRCDKERVANVDMQRLIAVLGDYGINIKLNSTRVDHNVLPENRDMELNNKLDEFILSKLVITDRLHGVIFSIITGTPCVALDNISHKISGLLSQICVPEYICMSNENAVYNDVKQMCIKLEQQHIYEYMSLKDEYRVIAWYIRNELEDEEIC